MTDSLRRALRTFAQTIVGTLIASGALSAASTSGIVDWSALQKAGVAALAAGIVALLSFTQNWLEDNTSVPALLKAPASEGTNPVPDADDGLDDLSYDELRHLAMAHDLHLQSPKKTELLAALRSHGVEA